MALAAKEIVSLTNITYRTVLVLILLCFIITTSNAQNKRDSLIFKIIELKSTEGFSKKDTAYIDLRNKLAKSYRFFISDSLYSISYQANQLSKKIDYEFGQSQSLDNLGDYFSDKGDGARAISYYKKALEITKKINDQEQQLKVLNNLSSEYAYGSNYSEALNGYLKGIDIATEIKDMKMLSVLNENIASLYSAQKDYDQALYFFKIVKKINEEIGDDIISAETMSNIAIVYSEIGKHEHAMYNVTKSVQTFEKHGILDWLAFAYEVKGRIYLKQKKYHWALHWFNLSKDLHKQLEDERGEIDLLNGLAQTYLHLENDTLSLQYATRGYANSRKIKSLQGQIDCSKTLYEIHKKVNSFDQALGYHEVFQKLSDSLSKGANSRSLELLETKLEYDRQKQFLIDKNEKERAKQRTFMYSAMLILLILTAKVILVYRGKKIQRKLYLELKEKSDVLVQREVELSGMNKTKNRLFSIIGHDLRGPIGALQGLLTMFSSNEIDQKEFLTLVPKLKADVDHIFFTLNNLLSWGQAQMNGVVTRPKANALEVLVDDNINLLAEVAAKKSIKMLNQLPDGVLIWADVDQIDIVIRNLISNALKFTPDNGLITIEATENSKNWEIMVRDTGIGMDEDTQKKIFSSNTNLTTYGTNNEKGTGLGLSLCKEMIEKNNGKIWVESFKRKGTCFYFTLPKADEKYKQTA